MEDKVCAGTSWGPFSMGAVPTMHMHPDALRGHPGAEVEEESTCLHLWLLGRRPQAQDVVAPTPRVVLTPRACLPHSLGGLGTGLGPSPPWLASPGHLCGSSPNDRTGFCI